MRFSPERLLAFLTLFLGAAPAFSQPPAFEVASIKQCIGSSTMNSSPGRLSLTCFPVMRLIQDAYDLYEAGKVDPANPIYPSIPIEGAPGWVSSETYSVEARAAAQQTIPMMRGPMMRTLLEQRFHLKTHRETREVPGYLMTVAEGGPKLKRTEEGSCAPVTADDFISHRNAATRDLPFCAGARPSRKDGMLVLDARGIGIDLLCKMLRLDRPVVDRTGLTGAFDIHLQWAPDPTPESQLESAAPPEAPGASIVAAIRAQLGLQIRPGSVQREFLVIDGIERPTAN